jgi:hypothetical protein
LENPLPEIITIDGQKYAKCQNCQTPVKLHPPGNYSNPSRETKIRVIKNAIARLSYRMLSYYPTATRNVMLHNAQLELDKLNTEIQNEQKSYYFRIPLYRVQDRRICADCFCSYYDSTYTIQGLRR